MAAMVTSPSWDHGRTVPNLEAHAERACVDFPPATYFHYIP